jgi:hypothetical protein
MTVPAKQKRPKLTDAERHERFVETAKKVGASEDIDDFDRAFSQLINAPKAGLQRSSRKRQR